MTTIHYAVQTCDHKNSQSSIRYATEDRALLTRKCVTSLLHSIKYASENIPNSNHYVIIIDDGSSKETIEYFHKLQSIYQTDNVKISIRQYHNLGIIASIEECYHWLSNNGSDLVFQVQDDYLFLESAIYEMAFVYTQLLYDTQSQAIVFPYNDPRYWKTIYRYASTPRAIVPSKNRYWIQIYDIPCTFMTSVTQFDAHWDLYKKFFSLGPHHERLEPESLNKILVERGVLGLAPIESVALHMQGEAEKDPYINWKERWDSIPAYE